MLVLWKSDEIPIGFSVADRIIYGQEAYMHLHILTAAQRKAGNGTACVREDGQDLLFHAAITTAILRAQCV